MPEKSPEQLAAEAAEAAKQAKGKPPAGRLGYAESTGAGSREGSCAGSRMGCGSGAGKAVRMTCVAGWSRWEQKTERGARNSISREG